MKSSGCRRKVCAAGARVNGVCRARSVIARIAFGALLGEEVGMSILQVRTRTNGDVTLQEDTIRKFKGSLRGELISFRLLRLPCS